MKLSDFIQKHYNGIATRFAEKAGISQPAMSKYLAGRVPCTIAMQKIIEASGRLVMPSDFFVMEQQQQEEQS